MRKILKLVIILIVLSAIFYLTLPIFQYLTREKMPATPITEQWLDQKLFEWKPNETKHLELGASLLSLAALNIHRDYVTEKVISENLKLLVDSGVSIVRIELNYDPWLENNQEEIKKYDFAVNEIRKNGKKLLIADAAAERYRNKEKLTWEQFKSVWVERVKIVAERYKPDYYIVVKEPGWYWLMPWDVLISRPWTKLNDWITLTEKLIKVVKEVSPETKIAIATPGNSLYHDQAGDIILNYYKAAVKMEGLDIIGVDIYTIRSFEDTERFVKEVGLNGKELWILETWGQTHALNPPVPARESLDTKFVRVATYFAQKINGNGVVFFFTQLFAAYEEIPQTEAGQIEFYKKRTAPFYEVQKLAQEFQAA